MLKERRADPGTDAFYPIPRPLAPVKDYPARPRSSTIAGLRGRDRRRAPPPDREAYTEPPAAVASNSARARSWL